MKRYVVVSTLLCAAALALTLGGCKPKDPEALQAPPAGENAAPGTRVEKNLPGPNADQGMQMPARKPDGL